MVVQLTCFLLFIIALVFVLIDVVPIFWDWLSRIHIGRYDDKHSWDKSITAKGAKWLNKSPKIKVTDNTRLIVIDMLKGNYTKDVIQHWQEASLILGLAEHLKNNPDLVIQKKINKFLRSKFNPDGQWRTKPSNVDAVILAYAVLKLHFINVDHYKQAFDYCWELVKEHIGEDGTVQYRKSMKNYRYVDTIGFICPFLVAYGIKYKRNECIDLAVRQIEQYVRYGMLNTFYIPAHTYSLETKIPIGLSGWGRGLGWFSMGLMDAWNELPPDHPYKSVLEEWIRKFAKSAVSFQQENGNWNWIVTRTECRPDSSTTAALSWFFLNAAKIRAIRTECLAAADKAIHYLMKVTRRDGAVDFSQGDTKDIGVYSTLFNRLPFTQGLCIRSMNLYAREKEEAG